MRRTTLGNSISTSELSKNALNPDIARNLEKMAAPISTKKSMTVISRVSNKTVRNVLKFNFLAKMQNKQDANEPAAAASVGLNIPV